MKRKIPAHEKVSARTAKHVFQRRLVMEILTLLHRAGVTPTSTPINFFYISLRHRANSVALTCIHKLNLHLGAQIIKIKA